MDILTSNYMLHRIRAASSLTEDVQMGILVHVLVAALAGSKCTNWCLHSCCVPIGDLFDKALDNRLDLDPFGPG